MKILTGLFAALVVATSAVAQIPDDIMSAIRSGDEAALQLALEAGANPNSVADGGATPLMYAASNPEPAMVLILLERGAELDAQDDIGDPAINWASYYGHARVIEVLLAAGADTSLVGHGNAREILMRRGHREGLELMLQHQASAPDRSANEVALERAVRDGDVDLIETLASQMDISTARDWAGRPVLQVAARANRPESIRALIAAGADVNDLDAIGFSALFEAARDAGGEAVTALIELGADTNHVASENALNLTPMHMAAIGGSEVCINQLAAASDDVNHQGVRQLTPMMWALYESQLDAIIALLELGADPDLEDADGNSVRSLAEQYQIEPLLERLADG
jgi:ankyrin repeat protein